MFFINSLLVQKLTDLKLLQQRNTSKEKQTKILFHSTGNLVHIIDAKSKTEVSMCEHGVNWRIRNKEGFANDYIDDYGIFTAVSKSNLGPVTWDSVMEDFLKIDLHLDVMMVFDWDL